MLDQLLPPSRVAPRSLTRLLYPLMDRPFALGGFSRFYSGSQERFAGAGSTDWFEACLAELDVKYVSEGSPPEMVPPGPVIVVANHPFGILDAIVLGAVFSKQGRPLRVLANSLLSRFKELDDLIIPVDPYAGRNSTRSNVAPMRDALRLLRQGGILLTFPSGKYSS